MAEERIYIDGKKEREFIDELKKNNILGFAQLENIDIYLFFAALGYKEPKDVPNRTGFVRVQTTGNTDKKAKLSAFLLSTYTDDNDIDEKADFTKCIAYADKCSYAGYLIFKQLYEESRHEEEVLIKKLELRLKSLHAQYFN